ncbi:MAG TPA: hypothetical protein VFK13_10930 [Gemmatimonadaceae bacterium]|nr:hypothetical protein [Gemmatimonadaceae bacterium]
MYSDLIQRLRCVRPHAPSGLVVVADESTGRDIRRGVLGCPVCDAHYPIRDGVADFTRVDADEERTSEAARDASGTPSREPERTRNAMEEEVLRAAALLDLSTPGGVVVLAGEWGALAAPLAHVADRVSVMAVNAARDTEGRAEPGVSFARAAELPLMAGSARAAMLDAEHATGEWLRSAVDALRPGGRLVAPAGVPLPAGVHELAHDARQWVAERDAGPDTLPLVALGVKRARPAP